MDEKQEMPLKHASQPVHGGLNLTELRSLGLSPEDVLDFSASINPLGTAPGVKDAMAKTNLATYPDTECLELREALSGHLGVGPERILAGNGSTELIHLIARAYVNKGDNALIFVPTFGEYAAACRIQGVEPGHLVSHEAIDPMLSAIAGVNIFSITWDISQAISMIEAQRPRVVFLCNPNNPTGVYLDEATVREVARAIGDKGLLVLDEAYVSFTENAWDATPLLDMGNVALLRSMTKDYALTGLRLGYMLGKPEIVDRVRKFQYSWSVNALAQSAGIAALRQPEHVQKGREAVAISKAYLMGELGKLGLEYSPSTANFILVRVGDAAGLRLKLLKNHGLCVRDCASFGLPEHIRIGIRKLEECQRLVVALREVLSHG